MVDDPAHVRQLEEQAVQTLFTIISEDAHAATQVPDDK
jgi:hypothetical protein